MVLKIDGLNVLPYVEAEGIKWQRNDVDGSNAGRTMDGTMYRDRVATKIRLDVTCLPLKTSDAMKVLRAISPEYVMVEYEDPMYGYSIKEMYSNNIPATYINTITDRWEGIEFPLIER